MRKGALFSLILLALPAVAAAKPPVVVELYTAQGCGSCVEAYGYAAKLAERPGVLVLTCGPRACLFREGPKWLEARVRDGREAELLPRVDRRRVAIAGFSTSELAAARREIERFRNELGTLAPAPVEGAAEEPVCEPKVELEEVAGRSGSPSRAVALEALGNLRSRRSVSVLESAAEDRDPTVAKAAFDALTRIKAG